MEFNQRLDAGELRHSWMGTGAAKAGVPISCGWLWSVRPITLYAGARDD